MIDSARHPARSPEFLSRLHDGDLSAAERVEFESHRSHCAACRSAAAEFEAALALYRSNRPGPPASDLSARILRRLQSTSPRRSPWGVTFGVDLRWAGAFVTALLAVLIGSAVVVRRETETRRLAQESAPISVALQREESAGASPRQNAPSEAAPQASSNAPSRPARLARKPSSENRENRKDLLSPSLPVVEGAPASVSKRDALEQASSVPPASEESRTARPDTAAAGGVSTSRLAMDAAGGHAHPVLVIVPIDEAGAAPPLVGGGDLDLPEQLRGHEFVLVVEAGGQVREVKPADTGVRHRVQAQAEADRPDVAAVSLEAQRSLRRLRFQAGERPRLLRVRVE